MTTGTYLEYCSRRTILSQLFLAYRRPSVLTPPWAFNRDERRLSPRAVAQDYLCDASRRQKAGRGYLPASERLRGGLPLKSPTAAA